MPAPAPVRKVPLKLIYFFEPSAASMSPVPSFSIFLARALYLFVLLFISFGVDGNR